MVNDYPALGLLATLPVWAVCIALWVVFFVLRRRERRRARR